MATSTKKSKAAPDGSKEKKALDKAAEEKAGESEEARVFPESEANTAKDHATTASAIAAQVAPASPAGAAAKVAGDVDAVSEQLDRQDARSAEDEDKSLFGRIQRSGLVHNRDHVNGDEWIGPSVQTEGPEFNHRKGKTSVTPLTNIAPRTGMLVRPDGLTGDSFTIPEGFGPDKNPDAWGAVSKPDGKSLFG